jgi:hypothetical protein
MAKTKPLRLAIYRQLLRVIIDQWDKKTSGIKKGLR